MTEEKNKAVLKKIIHEVFREEGVFVASPENYIVYESGFLAGVEYVQKTAQDKDYVKCPKCKSEDVENLGDGSYGCLICGVHFA